MQKESQFLVAPFLAMKKIPSLLLPDTDFRSNSKKNAQVLVNYVRDLDLILVDHLISENNDPDNKWTYIPDGDQEGFQWKNGKWLHIEKVFTYKLNDGEAPRESPILDQRNNQKIGNQ